MGRVAAPCWHGPASRIGCGTSALWTRGPGAALAAASASSVGSLCKRAAWRPSRGAPRAPSPTRMAGARAVSTRSWTCLAAVSGGRVWRPRLAAASEERPCRVGTSGARPRNSPLPSPARCPSRGHVAGTCPSRRGARRAAAQLAQPRRDWLFAPTFSVVLGRQRKLAPCFRRQELAAEETAAIDVTKHSADHMPSLGSASSRAVVRSFCAYPIRHAPNVLLGSRQACAAPLHSRTAESERLVFRASEGAC